MVIRQWRKGRLFWGLDQPVGQNSPHPRPGRPRPTPDHDLQKARQTQGAQVCRLMPNHHNMRFHMVLVKAGPETRLEVSDPRGIPAQGPGSRWTLVSRPRLHPGASRLAGFLLIEGPKDEAGTSGRSDENQKAACKQPQKAFTSNALSHTMLGHRNTQTLSLKTKHSTELRPNTWKGEMKSTSQDSSFNVLHLPPLPCGRTAQTSVWPWRRGATLVLRNVFESPNNSTRRLNATGFRRPLCLRCPWGHK